MNRVFATLRAMAVLLIDMLSFDVYYRCPYCSLVIKEYDKKCNYCNSVLGWD